MTICQAARMGITNIYFCIQKQGYAILKAQIWFAWDTGTNCRFKITVPRSSNYWAVRDGTILKGDKLIQHIELPGYFSNHIACISC